MDKKKNKQKMKEPLNMRVDKAFKEKLRVKAKEERRPITNLVVNVMSDYCDGKFLKRINIPDKVPIGTSVIINDDISEWGDEKAGKRMTVTGYCEYLFDKTGGYELDGEGIYLREDFTVEKE